MSSDNTVTTADSWEENAGFWSTIIRGGRDRYRTGLTDLAVLDAAGDCTGLRVLDAGCGEGYLTRALTSRGAHVAGIDKTLPLIEAARDADPAGTYLHGSVMDLPFPPDSFDLVVANHLLNDLPDVDRPVAEFARVLSPGGRLVILMLHPCFYGRDAERTPLGVTPAAAGYFASRTVEQPFQVDGVTSPAAVTVWLRPLEDYTRALADNGLSITSLTEPHPSPALSADAWWRSNWRRPLLMLVVAAKLG